MFTLRPSSSRPGRATLFHAFLKGVPEVDLAEARKIIENWTTDYNTERPHTSLSRPLPQPIQQKDKGADHAAGSALTLIGRLPTLTAGTS
ncbi:integrase core domain-containing protein [uncultured Aliiroseovarius sp.]|uniref:integrase core domain-containing protein n=1 Tax=uncultured Aliiroseovarius sp. TaxID=1658783 RepID=UPI00338DF2EC